MSQLKLSSLANQAGTEETPIDDVIHGSARAWVNYNATGVPAAIGSYNVIGITDNGIGDQTVNFAIDMPGDNYCALANANTTVNQTNSGGVIVLNKTIGSVRIVTGAASGNQPADREFVSVSIFH